MAPTDQQDSDSVGTLQPAGSPTAQFKYFLDLPVEVRVIIYRLVLHVPGGVFPTASGPTFIDQVLGASLRHPKPDLSLLRVNKAIAVEAAYEFYATNTFHFRSSYVHWPGPDNFYVSRIRSTVLTWLQSIGPNASLIRRIEYQAYNYHISAARKQAVYDIENLRPLVPNLRSMVITYRPYDSHHQIHGNGPLFVLTIWLGGGPLEPNLPQEEFDRFIRRLRRVAGKAYKGVEEVKLAVL